MRPGNPRASAPARMPAALAGAVDLAAVKARSDAMARAAETPAPPAGSFVFDADETTFQTEVLDRSFQVPVILDLWAEWCQPCKQLSPVLERLAEAAGGAWLLAKVDVDANQRLAQALQAQSIPAIYAVIGGRLIPGFQGALPEPQVREFIDAVLQAAVEAGLSGAVAVGDEALQEDALATEPEDPRFAAAEAAFDAGDLAGAALKYQTILDAEPTNELAALAIRQVWLMQRLDALDPALVARADSEPTNVEAGLAAADATFAGGSIDAALERLIQLVRQVTPDEREIVRSRLIEFFDILGSDDPRVAPARRALAQALF